LEDITASGSTDPSSMSRNSSVRLPAVVALLVFAMVFVVALGSNRSLARVGGPGRVVSAGTVAGDVAVVLVLLCVVVLAAIVSALWSGRRRRRSDDEPEWVYEEPEMLWWEKPLLPVMTFLPAAGLVAAIVFLLRDWGGARHTGQMPIPPTSPRLPGRSRPGTESASHAAVVVHWWLFAALALVLLGAVVIAVLWRRAQPSEGHREQASEASDLRTVVEESLEELEREPDTRRAVIRAYSGMEGALARRGLGRRPFEAPLEYLARALVALRVSRPASEQLTTLFQRARFSEHAIEPAMKQEAIAALARVRDELAERGE
jgi:hypothetical protein